MKLNKGKIILFILILAAIWFTALNIREAAYITSRYTSVSIRYKEDGVKLQSLKAALEMEKARGGSIPEITAWKWVNEVTVYNNSLNRSSQAAQIIAAGNIENTAPMSIIQGNYCFSGDYHGCVLDSETAYALFGTVNAAGNRVTVNQTDYIIRGVVKTSFPVILVQGSNETIAYPNLEFVYEGRDREAGEQLAAGFIMQNGLPTGYMIIDSFFLGKLLGSALCLPVWIFYLLICLTAIVYFIRHRKSFTTPSFVLYGLTGLFTLIIWGVFLYLMTGAPVYLPYKIIPTKWSDFNNWENLISVIQNQVNRLGYLPPNSRDILLRDELIKLPFNITVPGSIFALIYCCVILYRCRRSSSHPG